MMNYDFVPLHLHTKYSLLDGTIHIENLMQQAKNLNIPAVAITDHGNMFGAIEFYEKAKEAKIKPILGCEIYIAGDRFNKTAPIKSKTNESQDTNKTHHLILLAKNEHGYKNLIQIVSKSYTEGFYKTPRADKDLLRQHNTGIIALSACLKGEIPYLLHLGQEDKALSVIDEYVQIFGKENFFLEIQDNGIPEQYAINKKIIEASRKTGVELVATNDCHYLMPDDWESRDVLLCIRSGDKITDKNRLQSETKSLYFKKPEEMYDAFSSVSSALKNTVKIAEMCDVQLSLGTLRLPQYKLPTGLTDNDHIAVLAMDGLKRKLNGGFSEEYNSRLNKELAMIAKMGFSSYLLIVQDFVNFAKEKGIPVGPGRGSVAGSLVAYALGITDVDPIQYHLLFERFLNPDRVSMPDIDVDFCRDRRQDVVDYVRNKYGDKHVAGVITFGAMAARSVIRDVGRVFDVPLATVDKIAKLIPLDYQKSSIESAFEQEPTLKDLYNKDNRIKKIVDVSKKLEGLLRHASTHAAGIVISPQPIAEYMPLYLSSSDKKNNTETMPTTQFSMESVEKSGLLKFDMLGLKTLTIIKKTTEYIEQTEGRKIDPSKIPIDDKLTFNLLKKGETTSVFQLESTGIRKILKRIKPENIEELIAITALYRPGPLGNGMVESFIKRKRKEEDVNFTWEDMGSALNEILKDTYGVIVYQEQVMQIANKIAGFTLAQADILRRAMGKKKPEEMKKQKAVFVSGAVNNGYLKQSAEGLFDQLAKFAEYGFNKSHSAAYAYLAYQTAYFKSHYPVEFMAANIDVENITDKISPLINECRRMKINLAPADILNAKGRDIEINKSNKTIMLGLSSLKGVGDAAINYIFNEKKKCNFVSFADFRFRVERKVNKKNIETLIYGGVLDSFYPELAPYSARQRLINEFNDLLKEKVKKRKDFNVALFNDVANTDMTSLTAELVEESTEPEDVWLQREFEVYGFYLSGHPVEKYRKYLNKLHGVEKIEIIAEYESEKKDGLVTLAGIINDVKVKSYQKDKNVKYAFISVCDESGSVDVIVASKEYEKYKDIISHGGLIILACDVRYDNGTVSIKAKDIVNAKNICSNIPDSEKNMVKNNKETLPVSNQKTPEVSAVTLSTSTQSPMTALPAVPVKSLEQQQRGAVAIAPAVIYNYTLTCTNKSCEHTETYESTDGAFPVVFCQVCLSNEYMVVSGDGIDDEKLRLLESFYNVLITIPLVAGVDISFIDRTEIEVLEKSGQYQFGVYLPHKNKAELAESRLKFNAIKRELEQKLPFFGKKVVNFTELKQKSSNILSKQPSSGVTNGI